MGDTYLVDLRKMHRGCAKLFQVQEESDEEAQMATLRSVRSMREAWAQSPSLLSHLSPPRSAMTVVHFDLSGKHVYVGTSVGSILVFNTRTKSVRLIPCRMLLARTDGVVQMVARHKISGAGIMRGLEFAKSGRSVGSITQTHHAWHGSGARADASHVGD